MTSGAREMILLNFFAGSGGVSTAVLTGPAPLISPVNRATNLLVHRAPATMEAL